MKFNDTFMIEDTDHAVVLTPLKDLSELDSEKNETLYETILELFEYRNVKKLVVDLLNADYFGSSALGFFVKLWQQIQSHGGEMALCNVSEHAEKVLKVSHLDTLWPLCESRTDALNAVSEEHGS